MTFAQPLFLLSLLVVPLVIVLYLLAQRRRARYAVKFTNMDVLASVVSKRRSWRRYVAPLVFLLALSALCVALARPQRLTLVASQQATVILVVDVSGSMHSTDVKPTRLGAAQKAVRIFLDHAPKNLRVALIAFSGDANIAAPPTTDHNLIRQADDTIGDFTGNGGTAIGDALALAVEVAQAAVGPTGSSSGQTIAYHPHGAQSPVSIVFLSDGHQTRGALQPLQGAAQAKAAGIPVFTVALGTPNGTLTFGNNGFGGNPYGGPNGGFGGTIPVPPDPVTLHAIANLTGGKFTNALNAKTLNDSYANLGSRLGRKPGKSEITNEWVLLAAALLVGAGLLSVVWAPRLP
jgi:Ca-activated chloride channel family protein